MPAWCLIKSAADDFRQKLKDGTIDPIKLAQMSSDERHAFFEKIVGTENATPVNALFESKLLLKNQKAGYISWAKRVAGISPQIRRDLLSRIERLDKVLSPTEEKAFLKDLASTRLGTEVTQEEAKRIFDMTQAVKEAKAKMDPDTFTFPSSEDRLAYGYRAVQLENYVNELRQQAAKVSFAEQPVKATLSAAGQIPGVMKSLVASLDNSYFGRQGIKTLLDVRTSPIWIKDFLKSWKDIGKQLVAKGSWYTSGDDAALDAIKADIYSRPNALNGKYNAGNYGLNVLTEEAYPSSLPEKIPLLGRLFKASEAAYNGGALRLRADLADRMIQIAEKHGVNTLDRTEAEGLGTLVSSLTGRGGMGKGNSVANALLFSVKFLRANFNTLTAHAFDPKATSFARKEAAKNLVSMISTVATVSAIAKAIDPNSVDLDPRSGHAGKIKVYGHWVDITGGMGSLVSLASRITPTYHNGELGFWTITNAGQYKKLTADTYGAQTALDVFENFWEGKLSPSAGFLRDLWTGQTYQGEKLDLNKPIDVAGVELGNQLPLSIQNYNQLKDAGSAGQLALTILDGLGISVSSSTGAKSWIEQPTKEQQAFLEAVGKDEFQKANDLYNAKYSIWLGDTKQSKYYQNLSDDGKQKLMDQAKKTIQKQVFSEYGFTYKKPAITEGQQQEKDTIKSLKPQ